MNFMSPKVHLLNNFMFLEHEVDFHRVSDLIQPQNIVVHNYYQPQRSCGQGNVFTGVCLSTGGGGCLPQCMLGYQIPLGPGRHPPGTRQTPPGPGRPPGKQTAAYGLRAAGTHPTGMHSCFLSYPTHNLIIDSIL